MQGVNGLFTLYISVAKVAVMAEKDVIPVMIQSTEKVLPMTDFGIRSPYPTVDMVMKLHHMLSNQPFKNDLGKTSTFCNVSVIQQTKPAMAADVRHIKTMGHIRKQERMR